MSTDIQYKEVTFKTCTALVKRYHYSNRMPMTPYLCFGAISYNPRTLHACIIFSKPQGRENLSRTWELSRLVRLPTYDDPLTKLLRKAIGKVRETQQCDLLLSFADTSYDHHGGIYQSASWIYDGLRESRFDGLIIDGRFMPARTCNYLYGTSSPKELKKKFTDKIIESHFDGGKHLYWKPVNKQGMRTAVLAGLRSKPYPKPMLYRDDGNNYSKADIGKGVVDLPSFNAEKPSGPTIFGDDITSG